MVSVPVFSINSFELNSRVELLLISPGRNGHELCSGIITGVAPDSMEIKMMSGEGFIEKRRTFRVPCQLKLRYMEEKGTEEIWYTTYSINISPGGLRMYSPRFHKEGDELIFQFNIPEGFTSRHLLVRGTVVGVKRSSEFTVKFDNKNQSNRRFLVQVRFERLSPRDQLDIIRYIYTVNAGQS